MLWAADFQKAVLRESEMCAVGFKNWNLWRFSLIFTKMRHKKFIDTGSCKIVKNYIFQIISFLVFRQWWKHDFKRTKKFFSYISTKTNKFQSKHDQMINKILHTCKLKKLQVDAYLFCTCLSLIQIQSFHNFIICFTKHNTEKFKSVSFPVTFLGTFVQSKTGILSLFGQSSVLNWF